VAVSQRTRCCADGVVLAVQKAWIKPSGESEPVCRSLEERGAAGLREDGVVGKDGGGIDSLFLVGRRPVVTVMWQSERNRVGGQVLVCLF